MANTTVQRRTSFESTLASAANTISFKETVALAIDSFKASKARFLLTMLGMVIGSASIILVFSFGLSGKKYALDMISSLGPNKVEMQYAGGDVMGPGNVSTPDSMTIEDMRAVADQVPGIIASSPMIESHYNISIGNGVSKNAMLLGVSPQYRQVRNLKLLAGRFFDDQDATTHASVVVMVASLATELYGDTQAAVGKTVSVSGIPFTVIGVFTESMDTFGTSEISERTLLTPYEVARYFKGDETLKEIFFSMHDSSEVEPAAKQITQIISSRHRSSSVYKAQTLTEVLGTMDKIATRLTIVFTAVSFITLLVSGVGIMNSMLANVKARTREIGIRKALGATRREIRMQFLTEAVFLSLSGGIVGCFVGLAVPISISFLTPYKLPIDFRSAIAALLTSVLVGVAFGTFPANGAAALDPVETLKYE